MRKIATTFLCCIAITSFAQKGKSTDDKRFTGLDTVFAKVLKDLHAAGFSVAVVEKNKVVYAKGFGYANVENKVPATENTLYAIGSCTKAFTASLLGMLNKDGKVDFDKPVRQYLPDLKFYNDAMNDNITLRDMMCHRTGLPRHDYSWYYFTTQSRDSLLQRIQYMEPSATFRTAWQYNNFMFLAQGVVTEKITGKSWEQNIKEKIFTPLGMDSSDLSIAELEQSKNAATGYDVKNDSIIKKIPYYHIDAMGPAGSINSSVSDMAKWVITWINAGKYMGKEIIPAPYVSQAISSQMIIAAALPTVEKPELYFSNYGFGWFLSSYKGHYRVEHGGNIDGFSASTSFFPTDSIGIIVLCNQNGSSVPAVVRNILADRMFGFKYYDWTADVKASADKAKKAAKDAETSLVSNRKTNTTPSHELKSFTGLYSNKGYGTIEVVLQNDSLFALLGTHTWWLRHYHYDLFQPFEKDPEDGYDTTDKNDPVQFNMNTSGDIESVNVNFEPSLQPIVFNKTAKPKQVTKEELQKYVGDYLLSGITLKTYIKGDALYLFVPGQPEYELVPIDTNKFSIKSLSGFTVQFNTDDKGNITELLSIQPNGTFKAIKNK